MRRTHALLLFISIGSIAIACDGGSTDAKAKTDGKAKTEVKNAKAETKATDAKAVDAKAVDAKAVDAKADDAKADDAKADDAKAADAKAATPPAPAPAPATAEEAARQLGAWLDDASKAPAPALLTATSEIELVERCGACDGKPKPKTSKLAGLDAVSKRAGELAAAVASGEWNVEAKLECKKDCCSFKPEADAGVGDNVVNLEKVCVAADKAGKPTAYKSIETSGSF